MVAHTILNCYRIVRACVCTVPAGSVQDRAEAWRVFLGGEEEGETLHGAAPRAEDVQDFHEDTAAVPQVWALARTGAHARKRTQI